jgi:hypothetical protein
VTVDEHAMWSLIALLGKTSIERTAFFALAGDGA